MNFLDTYDLLCAYCDLENTPKDYIQNPIENCRFCGNDPLHTKFDSSSHAIPELLGNKKLYSLCECRKCNTKFGEVFEDSFGKFVLPFKIISQIYGKKNFIHHKESNDELLMKKNRSIFASEFDNVHTIIIGNPDSSMISQTENGFVMKIERQTYIPQLVYFTLLKMAYGIIPNKYYEAFIISSLELGYIVRDATFIRNKTDMMHYVNPGFLEFVPGEPAFTTSCYIYIKKDTSSLKYADFFFIVTFGNFSLQIAVPTDEERRSNKRATAIPLSHFENSVISTLDFNTVQKDYTCEFEAKIIPIENLEHITELLKKNNLII